MLCSLVELVGSVAIALSPHACAAPGVIDIDLSAHTLSYNYSTYAVGTGTTDWPTPEGTYMVTDEMDVSAYPAYAPIGLVTSARGRVGQGFDGTVVIHGSPSPGPGPVSHGCIRMHPADITDLADEVGPGTPIHIHK